MIGRITRAFVLCLGLAPAAAALEIGVNGHPMTAYPGIAYEEQIALVAGMGATSYRVNVSSLDHVPALAQLIAAAKPRGVTILPVLTPDVDLGSASPDEIYWSARSFAIAFASRFHADIPVWELGNEMETFAILLPCETRDDGTIYPCEWGPAGGVGGLDYFGPRWEKVSAALRGLSEGVADVDPALRRAIGSAGWGHLGMFERLAADGVPWDISVWHIYGEDPEWAFAKLAEYGRPIWITEVSHPYGSRDGDAAQAEGLRRMLARLGDLADRFDIEAAHVYELLDEPYWAPSFEASMGLVRIGPTPEGGWRVLGPKPAYFAARPVQTGQLPR
jgi:hypothetical protein